MGFVACVDVVSNVVSIFFVGLAGVCRIRSLCFSCVSCVSLFVYSCFSGLVVRPVFVCVFVVMFRLVALLATRDNLLWKLESYLGFYTLQYRKRVQSRDCSM